MATGGLAYPRQVRRPRTETIAFWGVRAIVLAAAVGVALAVPVVPALETLLGSEGWARAAEDRLLVRIGRITEATEDMVDRVGALEQRVGILEEMLLGGG